VGYPTLSPTCTALCNCKGCILVQAASPLQLHTYLAGCMYDSCNVGRCCKRGPSRQARVWQYMISCCCCCCCCCRGRKDVVRANANLLSKVSHATPLQVRHGSA
jgi:hypothetical protein